MTISSIESKILTVLLDIRTNSALWLKRLNQLLEEDKNTSNKEIKIEISSNYVKSFSNPEINFSEFDFRKIHLALKGDFSNYIFNFSKCKFGKFSIEKDDLKNSLFKKDGYQGNRVINFSGATFDGDVTINANISSLKIDFQKAKFLSEKVLINLEIGINDLIVFDEVEFGEKDKDLKQDLEIEAKNTNQQDVNQKLEFKNSKFFVKKATIKTNLRTTSFINPIFDKRSELNFEHIPFNSSIFGIISFEKDGADKSKDFIFDSQFEINFKDFARISGSNLIFRNCKEIGVSANANLTDSTSIQVKEINNCILGSIEAKNITIASQSIVEKNITIASQIIVDSKFHKSVSIFDYVGTEASQISKTTFSDKLTAYSNNRKLIIEECIIPILEASNGDLEIINSKKIGKLTTNSCQNLVIKNSVIKELEASESLNHLEIFDTIIESSKFANCQFTSSAIFDKATFTKAPVISNIKFASCNVDFKDVKFEETDSVVALGSYRALLKACSDAGYEHGVILFHALELKTHYNVNLKGKSFFSSDGIEKISSKFNELVTNYGQDLVRPLIILWFVLFQFGISVNSDGYKNYCLKPKNQFTATCDKKLVAQKSIFISFKNTLGPLQFALPKAPETKQEYIRNATPKGNFAISFAFIQVLISSLMWFLLILMVRRRFKI